MVDSKNWYTWALFSISFGFVENTKVLSFANNKGNIYNGMDLVIEGPDKDLQLKSPKAHTGAWQAWQDFFEDFVIYR